MLHEFLTLHRDELIERCKLKAALRYVPASAHKAVLPNGSAIDPAFQRLRDEMAEALGFAEGELMFIGELGYWGDIDTWGLHYLATVRRAQPHVTALMMDRDTIQQHLSGVVDVKEANPLVPTGLVSSEVDLYRDLLERRYGGHLPGTGAHLSRLDP